MSELALQRIAENKDKHVRGEDARKLDLRNCGLNEVPEEIANLVWLEELKIGLNELKFLEETNLNAESREINLVKAFFLSKKIIRQCPNLPKLKKLIINKTSAIVDLHFISNLTSLNVLICKSVVLSSLNGIENLTNITNLNISNTIINDFSILKNLTLLKVFKCSKTYVDDISFLENLTSLQNLYLDSTYVQNIEYLKYLKNLRRIDLQYSSDVNDLTPLSDLIRLREINIAYTSVTDLSPLITLLSKGKAITRKYLKNTINIRGCKVVTPPSEIIKKGNTAILQYFAERSKQQFKSTEVKLILIGNSTTGKTSLSRYLREKTYDPRQPTTHGIQNHRWQVPEHDIQVNIWDFGGQEYYHATHRLFLSRNAVYALVWDTQTDKGGIAPTEIYYENDPKVYTVSLEHFSKIWWLQNIHFNLNKYARHERESDASVPVLLVQNKCAKQGYDIHNPPNELDQKPYYLPTKWRNNHIDIEAAANEQEKGESSEWTMRFQLFERELLKTLESQMMTYEFAVYHRDIRDRVRALASSDNPVNEMSWIDFEVMCRDIEPDAKMDLVQIYLRDITGDILYFDQNERLKRRVFLRPDWVCNRIYAILSRKVLEREGLFDLSWVLDTLHCNEAEALNFVEIMREFDLIFPDKEESGMPNGKYVAPQYLPETCHKSEYLQGLKEDNILTHAFTLWFPDFLPKSHIARFICNWGEQAEGRVFWKNGLLFKTQNLKVLVERTENFKIQVEIQTGNKLGREEVMRRVFQSFLDLEEEQTNFAISLDERDFVWWDDVQQAIQMQAKRVKTYPSENSKLIDLHSFIVFQKSIMATKKVFISYSKSDKEYLAKLKTHLKIFERQHLIEVWDDSRINAGEEWDMAIKRELNAADIILLLVSADLLATDYVWDIEMQQAMQRHQNGLATFIPIIIRPCAWTGAPFGILNALPEKGKPISTWANEDEAWAQIVERIRQVV